jgi:hypothetical protein
MGDYQTGLAEQATGHQAQQTSQPGQPSPMTLNPLFVEWLQGFPIGWTDLEPSATPSCQQPPSSPSAPCGAA